MFAILVDHGKPFLGLDAAPDVVFVLFAVPLLLFVIDSSDEVGAYFVMEHVYHPVCPVLYWKSNVHPRFLLLSVMHYACWGH